MDITKQFQSFIAQYTGVITGDTPQNNGQCVGLVEKWLDAFSLPHIWGNALDLLSNADKTAYTVVTNTPTNSPAPGDIFVFGPTYGGGFGHTGVVTSADVNSVTLFEQNDPLGHAPQLKTYTYNGALGWIHPNIFTATSSPSVTDQQVTDQLNAQIQATTSCQQQLKDATLQAATLQSQLTDVQDQLKSSEEGLKDAKVQNTTLQAQLDGEQKEILNLHAIIETQNNSSRDYAAETLDLTHERSDLTNYLFATADKLGITRTNKKPIDIEEGILTKLDEVDLLLKAAGLGQGLLHQVAKTFQIDAPDDKTAATNIIEYVKGLGGKLQSLRPASQQATITAKQPNIVNRFFSWLGLWKSKGVA